MKVLLEMVEESFLQSTHGWVRGLN